jgi:hypothetical protein
LAFAAPDPKLAGKETIMPLPHFLALILAVVVTAGLTIWAASGLGLSMGALAIAALLAALAIRAFAWP